MSTQDVSTIDDVRIDGINDLVSPNEIIANYPVPAETAALIEATQAALLKLCAAKTLGCSWLLDPARYMTRMQLWSTHRS